MKLAMTLLILQDKPLAKLGFESKCRDPLFSLWWHFDPLAPRARFSKAPETAFRARKVTAKPQTLRLQRCFVNKFLI